MKKLFILSFASILLLTGCGATETLSCSYRNTANNGTADITYDIDHEGNEVKKVRITYDYDFSANNGTNTGTGGTTGTTGTGTTGTDTTTGTTGDTTARARVGDNNTNGMTNGTNGTDNDDNSVVGDSDFGADEGTRNGMDTTNGMTGNNTTGNNNTDGTNNNGITTYNNDNGTNTNNDNDDNDNHTDGVGTGTDGTTNDSNLDDDGVVDGIVGSAIDTIVGTVTDIILDSAGLRDRHATVQNTYGNVSGFSVQNTNDTNDNYKVTYVIDYDTISDDDLARFNLSRDLDDLRDSYVSQGFTCK